MELQLALLLTCRQIRREADLIFFESNHFLVGADQFQEFLNMTQRYLQCIRSITIFHGEDTSRILPLLWTIGRMEALRTLTVDFTSFNDRDCGCERVRMDALSTFYYGPYERHTLRAMSRYQRLERFHFLPGAKASAVSIANVKQIEERLQAALDLSRVERQLQRAAVSETTN